MIPGRALHRVAAALCSAKTLERAVEPAIADLQKEYDGNFTVAKRARILVTGYAAIFKVIAICALRIATTDAERRFLVRTWVLCVSIVVAFTALLMVLPLLSFAFQIRGWYAAVTLVPQAAPLAIPTGIAFGTALGVSTRPTLNVMKSMLVGAAVASILSFGVLVWAMPAGNQAFREIAFRAIHPEHQGPVVLQKGYNEMTFSELRGEIERYTAHGPRSEARMTEFHLHLRIALAGATIALVCLMLANPAERRWLRSLAAFTACFAYWALILVGELGAHRGYLAPSLGAWLPNVMLIASAIVIAFSRPSRGNARAKAAHYL